jgi:LmbE family N-acetylglucosaminyl deacetylase
MTERRLLGIFAHPDDESRIVGGALAKYASEGVQVDVLVATRGEVGSCGEPPLCSPEELPRIREAELRAACTMLGVHDLVLLDYRDGTLTEVDRRALIGDIVAAIRRMQPHVVITFGPEGRTLHPDHIVIHEAATAAFHLAADPCAWTLDNQPLWAAPKLYYSAIPASQARATQWRFPSIPDDQVTVALDVASWIAQKKQATNEAHRTQAHDQPFGNLSEAERWRELSTEYFRLAATHGMPHPQRETDLFED